jgi:hypothetical protein
MNASARKKYFIIGMTVAGGGVIAPSVSNSGFDFYGFCFWLAFVLVGAVFMATAFFDKE